MAAQDEKEVDLTNYWKFSQWFRKAPNDAHQEGVPEDSFDISAVEFDEEGDYLATGDNSGNIVVLRNDPKQARNRGECVRYVFHNEFQSHFSEFDFVSSTPIQERINSIKWGPKTNDAVYLLVTNCKHIKLWKIINREPFRYVNLNLPPQEANPVNENGIPLDFPRLNIRDVIVKELKVPKIARDSYCPVAALKKWYPHEGHSPMISHLGVSPDKETFLSADFFKINLWDFYRSDSCYTIGDFLPKDGSPPKEVITCMEFHPSSSHLFLYGTNLGNTRIIDMRQRALAQKSSKLFQAVRDPKLGKGPTTPIDQMDEKETQSLFDEVTSGVAGAKFSKGGRYIVTRDYMSVKIWDVRYEKRPFETFYVHEYLREKLFEMYSQDLLQDAFGLGLSSKGDIVTGSYHNYFHLFEMSERRDVFLRGAQDTEAWVSRIQEHNKKRKVVYASSNDKIMKKKGIGLRIFGGSKKNSKATGPLAASGDKNVKNGGKDGDNALGENKQPKPFPEGVPEDLADYEKISFNMKILDCAWHPSQNAVAVTAQNSLYIYSR